MKKHYLLKDVARRLKIKPYRIVYAISVGLLPEPALRISNKRVFVESEVEQIKEHFARVDEGGQDGE